MQDNINQKNYILETIVIIENRNTMKNLNYPL